MNDFRANHDVAPLLKTFQIKIATPERSALYWSTLLIFEQCKDINSFILPEKSTLDGTAVAARTTRFPLFGKRCASCTLELTFCSLLDEGSIDRIPCTWGQRFPKNSSKAVLCPPAPCGWNGHPSRKTLDKQAVPRFPLRLQSLVFQDSCSQGCFAGLPRS